MKKILPLVALGASISLLNGCATVTSGRYQKVSLQTYPAGAHCLLSNNKGKWSVPNTPRSIKIHRSMSDLHITCQESGYQPSVKTVQSHAKKMMAGNILIPGSIIGAAVDASTGAGFSYPNEITVVMNRGFTAPIASKKSSAKHAVKSKAHKADKKLVAKKSSNGVITIDSNA